MNNHHLHKNLKSDENLIDQFTSSVYTKQVNNAASKTQEKWYLFILSERQNTFRDVFNDIHLSAVLFHISGSLQEKANFVFRSTATALIARSAVAFFTLEVWVNNDHFTQTISPLLAHTILFEF